MSNKQETIDIQYPTKDKLLNYLVDTGIQDTPIIPITPEDRAKEWKKCRDNPFYFIYRYVWIPEIGDKLKVTPENLHPKMRRIIKCVCKYHKVILMASRQLGKSTIAACLLAWALVFYQNNTAIILNMKQNAALKNLLTIRFIIQNLPSWMVTEKPFKTKSNLQSYLVLFNGSRVDVFYPSTVHDSSTLARSLTSPILYIDEGAFIKDMDKIFGLMLVQIKYFKFGETLTVYLK